MQKRSPFLVFFLSCITFGIYSLVWFVKTKNEMNAKGAEIPTAWLLIIPIANYICWWKFCQGVELVTNKGMTTSAAFLWVFFLEVIGMAVIQSQLNKVAA